MSEFNYLREKARYLKSIGWNGDVCDGVDCFDCILGEINNGTKENCADFEIMYPDEATNLIKNWAESHPVITNAQKIEEVFDVVVAESSEHEDYIYLVGKDGEFLTAKEWLREEYKGGE